GLKGTALSAAKSGTSGSSATTNDMNDVLSRDLNRTTVIVIIGVLLVLFLVIRSFWTPVFITASLLGAYYAAMFAINYIFIDLMGYEGISSFVPFFSFIIIVSLGVDYSIFLMMRFKEYPDLSPKEAIVLASKNIGGVIISAVIILGGTFATLMPSGMVLLTELAIAVITGLVVLCFILLPLFVPALIVLPDTLANLFSRKKDENFSLEKEVV
ncbi:MMPL family transporter, partial [Bacillus sp. JJ1764]|uniref:MMPL family transporter n=1 Tax=Bacillus sp. JJ1764 TaxID=3122964 RepID=UPI003000B432